MSAFGVHLCSQVGRCPFPRGHQKDRCFREDAETAVWRSIHKGFPTIAMINFWHQPVNGYFVRRFMQLKDIPGLPPLPTSNAGWQDWKRRVLEHRITVLDEISRDEEARAREIVRCNRSGLYFMNTYGAIYEARGEQDYEQEPVMPGSGVAMSASGDEVDFQADQFFEDDLSSYQEAAGRGGVIPYIMYPFQIESVYWINKRMASRGNEGDGAIIKARDMGMTNTLCFWGTHKWMYRRPFQMRLLSRKEELVDRTGDPDSMFWKIDTFLMSLPDFLFYSAAPGFDWRRHRMDRMIINPSNQNTISGESTTANAGRGGRASIVVGDEFAFMRNGGAIWSTLRASTNHRIMLTTPSVDEGMDAYDIVHAENGYSPIPVLKIPWDAHPEHDQDWYDREASRDEPMKFAREVLMDWFAGSGEWVYPEARDISVDTGRVGLFPYEPGAGPFIVTMDDGYDDDWALVFLQYHEKTGRLRVLNGYKKSHMPVDYYGSILKGIFLEQFHYDTEARTLMWWLKHMPPAIYFGDAHGAHIEMVSEQSAYGRLSDRWGIDVNFYIGTNEGTTLTFKQRRLALGKVLPTLDVNETPGAMQVLQALKNHRFKSDPDGNNSIAEQRTPVHSKWSHYVSAVEYLAVQFDHLTLAMGMNRGEVTYVGARSGSRR